MFELGYIFDERHEWVTCLELAKRYRRESTPRTWLIKPPKGKKRKAHP